MSLISFQLIPTHPHLRSLPCPYPIPCPDMLLCCLPRPAVLLESPQRLHKPRRSKGMSCHVMSWCSTSWKLEAGAKGSNSDRYSTSGSVGRSMTVGRRRQIRFVLLSSLLEQSPSPSPSRPRHRPHPRYRNLGNLEKSTSTPPSPNFQCARRDHRPTSPAFPPHSFVNTEVIAC